MILVKLKRAIPQQEADHIRKNIQEFFKNERVLIVNSEYVEIAFINEGKKRCGYCSILNEPEEHACSSCGAPL